MVLVEFDQVNDSLLAGSEQGQKESGEVRLQLENSDALVIPVFSSNKLGSERGLIILGA